MSFQPPPGRAVMPNQQQAAQTTQPTTSMGMPGMQQPQPMGLSPMQQQVGMMRPPPQAPLPPPNPQQSVMPSGGSPGQFGPNDAGAYAAQRQPFGATAGIAHPVQAFQQMLQHPTGQAILQMHGYTKAQQPQVLANQQNMGGAQLPPPPQKAVGQQQPTAPNDQVQAQVMPQQQQAAAPPAPAPTPA